MKALSIRQPWPWCIFYAGKPVENRDWQSNSPNMRDARRLMNTEILIHAGKGMTRAEYEGCLDTLHSISVTHPFPAGLVLPAFEDLPRGGIVGRAQFIGIVSDRVNPDDYDMPDRRAARLSPWFYGPYGLVLADAKPTKFIPFKGALGFFDVPDEIAREALAA